MDNSIHWVNLYPADGTVFFADIHQLDSDLSVNSIIRPLNTCAKNDSNCNNDDNNIIITGAGRRVVRVAWSNPLYSNEDV